MTLTEIKAQKAYKMHYKDWADLKAKQSKDGFEVTLDEVHQEHLSQFISENKALRKDRDEAENGVIRLNELVEAQNKENKKLKSKNSELLDKVRRMEEEIKELKIDNEALSISAHFQSDDEVEANLRNQVFNQHKEIEQLKFQRDNAIKHATAY